ncbi:MAG: hypothetical protein IPJ32_20085 [Sphingobacteriaceae bacterium]|nr:hypothetical protein [Sphingobacteriaceae bacterium]
MNPRVSLLVLITLIFFSCATDVKEETPVLETTPKTLISEIDTFYGGENLLAITDTTEEVFNSLFNFKPDTSERNNIARDSKFISRNGDTLFLKLDNGTFKKLVSDKDMESDNFADYEYIGKINPINYYLVFIAYFESFEYLMINTKTGKETFISGIPAISPNNKYLAASSCDLQAGFVLNGIEMYDIESDSLKLNWRRVLNKWGANELVWLSNHTLIAEKYQLDSSSHNLVSSSIKLSCVGK